MRRNFEKYTSRTINDMGVPYDYDSIMHYPEDAFVSPWAAALGQKSIVPRVVTFVLFFLHEHIPYNYYG